MNDILKYSLADLEVKEDNESRARASGPMPYCPVKIISRPDGSLLFTAHLVGDIKDVDDYIDLIDTLLVAREQDEYHIYIDSPGGYISAGSIIASAIEHSQAQVYTHAVGLCASAACLIHNAAKEDHALAGDFGILMIHMSLHSDQGVSSQIADRANDQVRYVLTNLLTQAKDMGYVYEDELETIKTGQNIYISAKEFRARIAAHKKGVRVDTNTEAQPIAGTEDFGMGAQLLADRTPIIIPNVTSTEREYRDKMRDVESCEMDMGDAMDARAMAARIRIIKANTLRIRTIDNVNFRIYIPSDLMFSRSFIINLCMFLDSLNENQSVTFILGAKVYDAVACNLGAVISAMENCRAHIITIAAGYCSIPESIIWTYGRERKVYRYGALTFGKTDIVRAVDKYDDYFKVAFERAKEVGIITDEDIVELNKFNTKMILRQDLAPDMYN